MTLLRLDLFDRSFLFRFNQISFRNFFRSFKFEKNLFTFRNVKDVRSTEVRSINSFEYRYSISKFELNHELIWLE